MKKKTFGDDLRPIESEDIVRANQLLYTTAALSLVFGMFLCDALMAIFGA